MSNYTPIWYSKTDSKEFNNLVKIAQGYCLECQRPFKHKHYLCYKHVKQLYNTGMEHKIPSATINKLTENYQQYLHRKFFGCNVIITHRGLKQNRIKTNITTEQILTAATQLRIKLSNKQYFYHPVIQTYLLTDPNTNIDKRIIYNTLLSYIAYYISKDNPFIHEAHFKSHIVSRTIYPIRTFAFKTLPREDNPFANTKADGKPELYRHIFNTINNCITPLLVEIVESQNW